MNQQGVSPAGFDELYRPHSEVSPGFIKKEYGLGFSIQSIPKLVKLYAHSGNSDGFSSCFLFDKDKKWGFVFFTNYGSRKGKDIDENQKACLLFYWDCLERQIRIEGPIEKINQAEGALTSALQSFVGYTEDNPEITATQNIHLLQKQLEETEDQIAASRRLFNGNVQAYNTKVLSIPWNFIADRKGFTTTAMFTVDKTEMKALSQSVNVADLGLDDDKT